MKLGCRGIAAGMVVFALALPPRDSAAGAIEPVPDGVTTVDTPRPVDGTYTVMWTANPDAKSATLSESVDGGQVVVTPIASGEYSRTFTGKPPGTYKYWTETRSPFYIGISNQVTVVVPSVDVGLIAASIACADGVPPIEIVMDDEDWHAASYASGWTGASYVDANKNTHFKFCKVDGRLFKPLTVDPNQADEYAVLKLGEECPKDSVEFGRYFDNEDGGNASANWNPGNIAPSWQSGGGTMLRFCLFRYGPDTLLGGGGYTEEIGWPDVRFSYGVFAGAGFSSSAIGYLYTDDEDDGTASWFDIPPTLDVTSVYRIMEGYPHWGGNTQLNMAQARYQ